MWTLNNSEPGSAVPRGWAAPLPQGWDSSETLSPQRQRGPAELKFSIPLAVGTSPSHFFALDVGLVARSQGSSAQRLSVLSAVRRHLLPSLTKWSVLTLSASAPWAECSSFLPFRDCKIPSSAWSDTGQGCKTGRDCSSSLC